MNIKKIILRAFIAYALCPILLYSMAPSPQIGLSLDTQDVTNARGTTIAIPCNPHGAVGPTQLVSSTYQTIRTFNRITGQMDNAINVDAAPFSAFEGAATNPSMYDVFMFYDPFSQRFYYSGENGPDADGLLLLVSDASSITPSTPWFAYLMLSSVINPPGALYTDYQQPATDQNAWYNCIGTFSTPDGSAGSFIGSTLTVIPTSSILAGSPTPTFFYNLFPQTINILSEGFAAPARNFDANPTYGYAVWALYDQPAGVQGNQIGLYRVSNAGTAPTLGPLVTITLPFSYAINTITAPHKGNLMGAVGLIQVTAGVFAPHVRNHQLYYGQIVQCDSTGTANPAGDRTGIRWFQFDLTGDSTGSGLGTESPTTVPVLIQTGFLFDNSASNPLFYNMPSLMTNTRGDMVLSFITSGANAYINAGYAFRSASDPLGELRTPVYVTNSTFPANFSASISALPGPNVQRWGDSSSAEVDPSNGLDFWVTQMYAGVQNGWAINATQLIAQ